MYHATNSWTGLYKSNNMVVTPKTDSILVETSSNGTVYVNSTNNYLTGSYVMEAKIVDFSNSADVYARFDDGSSRYRSFSDLGISDEDTIKMLNNGEKIQIYINNVLAYERADTGTIRFGFGLNNSSASLELTDVMLYPYQAE